MINTLDNKANIDKQPAQVSLSAVPNYMQISSSMPENSVIEPIKLTIGNTSWQEDPEDDAKLMLTITSLIDNTEHKFYGTMIENKISANTFFIKKEKAEITAQNLKSCLMKNNFITSNFELNIPFNTKILSIKPMGVGECYGFKIKSEDANFLDTPEKTFTFESNDTIDNGKGNALIELDVYTDSPVTLGETFEPTQAKHQGKYMTTIQKAYFKQPLWFNLNATFGNSTRYTIDFLDKEKKGWLDAGTCRNFHFMGFKNDGVNKEPFCSSQMFYVLNGYGRNLEENDMENYIYTAEEQKVISPLTLQPTLTHIKGQTQLFNFIASKPNNPKGSVALVYKLYTQSHQEIDQIVAHEIEYNKLNIVNTIRLEIDEMMKDIPNVGIVEVCLLSNNAEVSAPLTFHILPNCLHKVKDFAFLNSLGGWSSFGFMDNKGIDFSTSSETIFKTQTPDFTISSQIESVYNKESKEHFTVQTMPIRPQVAEWLKEISTSQAVYELDSKRYIIVEDMKIKYNTGDDLLRVEMKYRYSDSYNGRI